MKLLGHAHDVLRTCVQAGSDEVRVAREFQGAFEIVFAWWGGVLEHLPSYKRSSFAGLIGIWMSDVNLVGVQAGFECSQANYQFETGAWSVSFLGCAVQFGSQVSDSLPLSAWKALNKVVWIQGRGGGERQYIPVLNVHHHHRSTRARTEDGLQSFLSSLLDCR